MSCATVYVALGSNLGDSAAHVHRALTELDSINDCQLTARSPLYRSAPMGPIRQGWYVNAAAELQVALDPRELMTRLQALEQAHGRDRGGTRWGPRTLDLDILLFSDLVIDEPDLTIPHPGLTRRNFVVYPLLSIAPDLVLPDGRRLDEVASGLNLEGLEKMEDRQGLSGDPLS